MHRAIYYDEEKNGDGKKWLLGKINVSMFYKLKFVIYFCVHWGKKFISNIVEDWGGDY